MERPSKRMRIEDPDIRSPRDSSSRLTEGLFTSEMGIRSDDSDGRPAFPAATPSVKLTEFQHQAVFGRQIQPVPLQRRAEATVTVAASEVVVNVNDGLSTIVATTIAPVQSGTVLSLDNIGSVTIPANVTGDVSSSADTLASSVTSLSSDSLISSITQSPAGSVLSEALNSTLTNTITADTTVTVTTTATLDVAFINGTLFPAVLATATDETSSQSTRQSSTITPNQPSGIVMTADSTTGTATVPPFSGAGGAAASATSEAPAATSIESSGGGRSGSGPALTPQQQSVVGGVVGGVAGVALILVLILFLLRRYRARLKAEGRLPEQIAEREAAEGGGGMGMSQRSSGIPLTATLASSLRRFRPMSSHTAATDMTASTAPEGERGFQKIAGRKIAPVLSTGGDGYGGDYGAFAKDTAAGPSGHQRNEHSLAESSFYRDSQGFYGGRGTDTPTYPPSPTTGTVGTDEKVGPSQTRDFAGQGPRTSSQYSVVSTRQDASAALRPSPARTPVTVSPSPSSIRLPIQQTPTMSDAPPMPAFAPSLQIPDAVGRTLPHQDGSRVSARSRGSTRSRFAENV
jgi:hypothetical protein